MTTIARTGAESYFADLLENPTYKFIHDVIAAEIRRSDEIIEADLAQAMALQDFDKLDHLCVVSHAGLSEIPRAVASMLERDNCG